MLGGLPDAYTCLIGCRLVGVAEVAPTGNRLLDGFLRLPTDVLGLMTSQLTFQE